MDITTDFASTVNHLADIRDRIDSALVTLAPPRTATRQRRPNRKATTPVNQQRASSNDARRSGPKKKMPEATRKKISEALKRRHAAQTATS